MSRSIEFLVLNSFTLLAVAGMGVAASKRVRPRLRLMLVVAFVLAGACGASAADLRWTQFSWIPAFIGVLPICIILYILLKGAERSTY